MPRAKKEYRPAVYAADTETTTEDDYQMDGRTRVWLYHIRRVEGLDGMRFNKSEYDCKPDEDLGYGMDQFFEWIENRTNGVTVMWWFNLSFDGAFITDWALRHGYTSENYEEIKGRKDALSAAKKAYLDENDLPAFTEAGKPSYIPRKVTKAYDAPRQSFSVIKTGSNWIILTLVNKRGHVIKMYDLGNKYTQAGSLEDVAKTLGIPGKTELDLNRRRDENYVPDQMDIDRVKRDTYITAEGIRKFYEWGLKGSTLAGDAWSDYMETCRACYTAEAMNRLMSSSTKDLSPEAVTEIAGEMARRELGRIYPDNMPETFKCSNGVTIDIRDAYLGGIVYLNPEHAEAELDSVSVIDRNSMHPASMKCCEMPYGIPETSVGKPLSSRFICKFSTPFKIKKGMFPTVQKKGSILYGDAEWIYDSGGDAMELTMTDIDLKWFLASYDLPLPFESLEVSYLNFKHKRLPGLNMYVDKWYDKKDEIKKEMNGLKKGSEEWNALNVEYYRPKIMLNALYGKFGQDPVKPYQWGEINTKDVLSIEESDVSKGEYFPAYASKYLAVACFITAESRDSLMREREKLKDWYVYSDTDSNHFNLPGKTREELVKFLEDLGIEIHPTKLGAWDLEKGENARAKYLRAKTYIHEKDGELEVTCAGMPKKMKKHVTWDNFHSGAVFDKSMGKLMPKMRPGGKTLVPVEFMIKKRRSR